MFKSPSHLPEESRVKIAAALNSTLADGLDLFTQIKVAHWNIKGAQFASLHPLFETFANELAEYNDEVAERAVTLGGKAYGTARLATKNSRLPEYPVDTVRDLEHAKLLVERVEKYLEGARHARSVADQYGDVDTSDLLTGVVRDFEKNGWFLHATLGE